MNKRLDNLGERLVLDDISKPRIREDHLARYEFAKKYVVNKRVLDIACGTGYGASVLNEAGATEVVGVDIDQEAINYAVEKYGKTGLRFICDSVESVSFPKNYFDVVVTFETIEHLDDNVRYLYLELIKNVLNEDGVILLSTPNKLITSPWSDKPLNRHHVLEYYRNGLDTELKGHILVIKEWLGQRFVRKVFTYRISYIFVKIYEKLTRKYLHIYDIADSAEVRPVVAGKEPRYFVLVVKKAKV